jgi:uncharacterized damage-inducible protein DinB
MTLPDTATVIDPAVSRYTATLLETLGDRPWFDVMSEQLTAIHQMVDGLPEEVVRARPAPGKWSVVEVIAHLADSELVMGYRTRMVLAHDAPELQAYDQALWATRLGYASEKIADVLEDLRALRARNLRLWGRLTPDELSRYGIHRERGRESILYMLQLVAGHDLHHLGQMRRILGTRDG